MKTLLGAAALFGWQAQAHASGPTARVVDLSDPRARLVDPVDPAGTVRFDDLDDLVDPSPEITERPVDAGPPATAASADTYVPADALFPSVAARSRSSTIPPLEDFCAHPELVPSGIYAGDDRFGGEVPRRGTIYLNFVGATLQGGSENSAENESTIARSGHPFPAWTGGEQLAIAVAEAVAVDFADWGLRVVYYDRPPKMLPYTMVMIGGSYNDTTAGQSGGVAPIDCEDNGQRNVCYAFQNGRIPSAVGQATVASQEIAHTYGLGHTYGTDRIMSYEGGGDKIFGSNCQEMFSVAGQASDCDGVNLCHCGDPDLQNDKAAISAIFAPAGVDDTPPTIAILEPAEGDVIPEGEMLRVELEPWDDYGGYGWKVMIIDPAGTVLVDLVDYDRSGLFAFQGVPGGDYTVRAEIMDHADHTASAEVHVHVEGPAAETDGGETEGPATSGDEGRSGETSDGRADEGGDSDPGADGGGEQPLGQKGCGCAAPGSAPVAAWLALAGLVRRRRACRVA